MNSFESLCRNAKNCSYTFSLYSEKDKNTILDIMANSLVENCEFILQENYKDVLIAKENNKPKQFIDRLILDKPRIHAMAEGILQVKKLKDPIGEVKTRMILKNGLEIKKTTVPFGVVGIIYEARPNVTSDAAALCVKSGNVCVLRGSKDAINSNIAIIDVFKQALIKNNFKENFINLIVDTTHDSFNKLIKMNEYIDVIIPRGGASLIKATMENATVPVIETGTGNCHLYIEKTANYEMAKNILLNGKVSRPSVCNSLESLLVDREIANEFLPKLLSELKNANVEIRGCSDTVKICPEVNSATEDDFYAEFIDYIISVKVVNGIDDAIVHINKYSTHHSDCIVTSCVDNEDKFLRSIDSACVYCNASTRFTDGFEFGLGAEIGISTQKLHARGPMGLEEMTTYKYQIKGNGQIR